MGVRVPPLELDGFRKGKPMGDGTGSKPGATTLRAVPGALRVRLPPLPLFRSDAPRAPGRAVRHQSSKPDRRVQLPRGTLGNRLTGRLPDFESGGGGSNPPSRTWTKLVLSEPGDEEHSGAVAVGRDATL